MTSTPIKIYHQLLKNVISKSNAIDQIIILLENIEKDDLRKECIDILTNLNANSERIFKVLENLIISETNEEIRRLAVILLKDKFSEKATEPLLWALHHEKSFNCLMVILNSLANLNKETVRSKIFDNLKTTFSDLKHHYKNLGLKSLKLDNLIELLINFYIIIYLKEKFSALEYHIVNGRIVKLDFSKVDRKLLTWRDKKAVKDLSEIRAIVNLNHIETVYFFPLKWIYRNDINLECFIELVEVLSKLPKEVSRSIYLTALRKWRNNIHPYILDGLKLESFSLDKLKNLILNQIIISFLVKKYPSLRYKSSFGEIIKLDFENIKIVKLRNCIRYLNSLTHLNLKNTSLYFLPGYVSNFKHLKFLNLALNNLSNLPSEISALKELKYMNLDHNNIKIILSCINSE